tara:strand:- start:1547 stop:1768 length:222 start_codon:yes stop_codon:yes gene_type:complete
MVIKRIFNINTNLEMIKPLRMYLPPIEKLKEIENTNPVLLKTFFTADILTGDIESMEYIEDLKQKLNEDSTND